MWDTRVFYCCLVFFFFSRFISCGTFAAPIVVTGVNYPLVYTGSPQTFEVPAGMQLLATLVGAAGGGGLGGGTNAGGASRFINFNSMRDRNSVAALCVCIDVMLAR